MLHVWLTSTSQSPERAGAGKSPAYPSGFCPPLTIYSMCSVFCVIQLRCSHLSAAWPRARDLTSLGLGFLLCEADGNHISLLVFLWGLFKIRWGKFLAQRLVLRKGCWGFLWPDLPTCVCSRIIISCGMGVGLTYQRSFLGPGYPRRPLQSMWAKRVTKNNGITKADFLK